MFILSNRPSIILIAWRVHSATKKRKRKFVGTGKNARVSGLEKASTYVSP